MTLHHRCTFGVLLALLGACDPAPETDTDAGPIVTPDHDAGVMIPRDGGGVTTSCTGAADCDDGSYCNGAEVCADGLCQPGTGSPCTGAEVCFESADECRVPAPGTWTPPIGIPAPPFGIEETHEMYDGMSFDFGSGDEPYRSASHGPYTHYVDNTAACSDDDPFGTEASPRCTIPNVVEAGSVVEVHGGPYEFAERDFRFDGAGTEARPVFLRGIDDGAGRPRLGHVDRFDLMGTYLIVEGLTCAECRLRTEGVDHVSVRFNEIVGHPNTNGVTFGGTDIVLYANEIHHHQGNDRHGVHVASGSERVWVVDNDVHHNGGDGIQFCHGCSADPPEYVYIGRNVFHSDRENGVDFKYASHVIVSENTIYGYRSAPAGEEWCFDDGSGCDVFTSGSDGSAMVIGSDGAPSDVWVIANRIYDSAHGIRVEETGEAWIVGNIVYGVGRGVALEKRGDMLHIVGNLFHDVETGIDQFWRVDFTLDMRNNIFSAVRGSVLNIETQEVAERSQLSNNLFYGVAGAPIALRWGSQRLMDVTAASEIEALNEASGNVMGDPRFVDVASYDFHPGDGSPLIGAGTTSEVYGAFMTTYGLDIARDVEGTARPVDAWDIGPYER